MNLDEVIRLITEAWPQRYTRGRLTHIHRNAVKTSSGATVHLRVMIQTIDESPNPEPTPPRKIVTEL
jgi:hypothetical protein